MSNLQPKSKKSQYRETKIKKQRVTKKIIKKANRKSKPIDERNSI